MAEKNSGSLNVIEQAVLNRISQGEIKGRIHQLAMPYKELMAYYRCAMMQMETKFNVLNEELSLQYDRNPIETIKIRLKSPESIANKLIKKQVPLTAESIEENINDVAGVRVICSFQSDIYMLADALLKQDDITLLKRKDYIAQPKENGYRSLHLIVQIPIYLHDQKKLMKVEVQFRTISMDWWASLEHKIRYKKDLVITPEIEKELRECAEISDVLDRRMEMIQQKVESGMSLGLFCLYHVLPHLVIFMIEASSTAADERKDETHERINGDEKIRPGASVQLPVQRPREKYAQAVFLGGKIRWENVSPSAGAGEGRH